MHLSENVRVSPNLEPHQDAILNYCRRRTSFEDAEDAASEVMAIAWRRRQDLPEEHLRAYLYGIAFKVLANQRRAVQRQTRLVRRAHHETAESPEDIVVASEESHLVIVGLEEIAGSDREILRLAAWEQLSRTEIAAALGISENAVTKRFNRALDRLAAQLGVKRRTGSQFFKRNES